jgi:uncharacterized protein (DUF2062 family)
MEHKKKTNPSYTRFQSLKRWIRYKTLQLFRAKGGPAIVAKGFSIGIAIEMFTLPTLGLAALLILPLVYLFRASLPGALIGFLFGKIIYIPMAFLNQKVGDWIVPEDFLSTTHFDSPWIETVFSLIRGTLDLIVGGMIVGTLLGLIVYFPIKKLLELAQAKRAEKRKERRSKSESIGNIPDIKETPK